MPESGLLCGVDLGGTKISVALVDSGGKVRDRELIRDHRKKVEDAIMDDIARVIATLAARNGIAVTDLPGVGVGSSGHVDHSRGEIITNSNLTGFTRYPLRERLRERIGLPVSVDNDANAQAYAEFCFGAGRDATNMVFVTVSTGIGAGIVIDSRLYRGVTGTAGEVGHTIVKPDSKIRCGCGNYGCLMSHASGLALPQVVRQKLHEGRESSINFIALTSDQITGELIQEGVDIGDQFCIDLVREYADWLGIGLYNLFQTLNPGLIVVGGGLTEWGTPYLERVRERFFKLGRNMVNESLEIRRSTIGSDAAVVGAAALMVEPA